LEYSKSRHTLLRNGYNTLRPVSPRHPYRPSKSYSYPTDPDANPRTTRGAHSSKSIVCRRGVTHGL